MKKTLLSLLLVLVLAVTFVPAALADGLFYQVGTPAEQQLIRIPADAGYSADQVPPGMYIMEDPGAGSIGLYLTGTPSVAGVYDFYITSGDGQSAAYTIYVDPIPEPVGQPPYIQFYSHDVSCTVGDGASLNVVVDNPSGWSLEYIWYKNGGNVGNNGSVLYMDTSAPARDVYRCDVYGWKGGESVELTTGDIRTEVVAAPVVPVSARIVSLPTRTSYKVGEYLDVTGLALEITYSDNHRETVRETSIECIPYYYTQAGNFNISAQYAGCYDYFTVTVNDITGIKVNTMPAKTKYKLGEMMDMTGLTVRVNYRDGSYVIADTGAGLSCTPTVFNAAGNQNVTVSYNGMTDVFSVNVVDPNKVSGIAFRSMPLKSSYVVGDKLDPTGLVLDVRSEGGSWPLDGNDSRVTMSPTVLNTEGTQKITVTFHDGSETFTNEFSVFVNAKPAPTPTPAPTPAPASEPKPTEKPESEDKKEKEEKTPETEQPEEAEKPAEKSRDLSVPIAAAAAVAAFAVTFAVLKLTGKRR